MAIDKSIKKRIKEIDKKVVKIPERRRKAAAKKHQYDVDNFNRHEEGLNAEKPVLASISKINLGDPKETEKEKKALFNSYTYAKNGRNKIRERLCQSEKALEKQQKDIKKKNKTLKKLEKNPSKNTKKIRKKKAEIAHLELKKHHHNRLAEDSKVNYDFAQKIISNAGTDPDNIRVLKEKMKELNSAIEEQKKLQNMHEENEVASLKARLVLEKKGITIPDLTKRPQEITDRFTRDYVKHERRAQDSKVDYEFSREILKRAATTGETSGLKEQFKSLGLAIKERDKYRKALEAAEEKKLKNTKDLELLKSKIETIVSVPAPRSPKDIKEFNELQKKQRELELESIQQDRQIADTSKLHDFSANLIKKASANGDASELPKQLADLKVAASRQEKYRKKLNNVEKKLLNAKESKIANTNLSPNDLQKQDLRIEQLELQKTDAVLGHNMMNELIDVASAKGDPSELPKQSAQLREGIGGKRGFPRKAFGQERNRLNLEQAQNAHLEKRLERDQNEIKLNAFAETLPKKLGLPENAEITPLELKANIAKLSKEDIKTLKNFAVKSVELTLSEKQTSRRAKDAKDDHALGKAFLEHARLKKNPGDLKRQFDGMEAAVKERNKFTERLEKEENKQLKQEVTLGKERYKLLELERQLAVANQKQGPLNRAENMDQMTSVAKIKNQINYQEWTVKKLDRKAKENEARDAKRLSNAEQFHAKSNALLKTILDPNSSELDKKSAKAAFEKLKDEVKEAKRLEDELSPPAILKERDKYRNNLEAAEERELKLKNNKELLAIERLKAEKLPEDKQAAALAECDKKERKLELESGQTERHNKDAELIYNFSNELIQGSTDSEKAAKLPKQFEALKVADMRLNNLRNKLEGVENKLKKFERKNKDKLSTHESEDQDLKIKQLERQQKDLSDGHEMMHSLIQSAFESPEKDPSVLKKQCNDLREGIGWVRRFPPHVFGQERNRRNLEKAENLHLESKHALEKNREKIDALGTSPDPTALGKLELENKKLAFSETQKKRRLEDANKDYAIGQKFLEFTKNPPPVNPEKLSDLKEQFKEMEETVKERNKFTKRFEEVEEKKHEKELKLLKAKQKLAEINKKYTSEEEPSSNLRSEMKNQKWGVEKLKIKTEENKERDEFRLKNAKENHEKANEIMGRMLDPNTSQEDRDAAKNEFKALKELVKKQKEDEKKLAPPDTVKARIIFRKNLEKAEERELNNDKKWIPLSSDTIDRRKDDTGLVYDIANNLIKSSFEKGEATDGNAKKLSEQFEQLKFADTTQRNLRVKLEKLEKTALENKKAFDNTPPNASQYKKDKLNFSNIQSTRRAEDAKNDYEMGKALLELAKTKGPDKLKEQFETLKAAIKERNKFTENLEKIEEQAIKDRRSERKDIRKAKSKEKNIEKKLGSAQDKLSKLQSATPPNQKLIDAQLEKVANLQGKLSKQQEKITNLEAKSEENKERDASRIENAKQLHTDANTRLKEIHRNITGTGNETEKRPTFDDLKVKAETENELEKERKEDTKKIVVSEPQLVEPKKPLEQPVQQTPPPVNTTDTTMVGTPKVEAPKKPEIPKKELPAVPNSVTVTVHSSKIAQAQAIYKLEQLTKCKLHQDSEGVFSLMDGKAKKGEYRFHYDEKTDQMKMTATFTKPIDKKYIEATAIFAADDQLRDKDKEHREVVTNFTAGPGVGPDVIDSVKKTFEEQYDNVRKKKNMSLKGNAISDENDLVKQGELPQTQQKPVQPSAPIQPAQHTGGGMH